MICIKHPKHIHIQRASCVVTVVCATSLHCPLLNFHFVAAMKTFILLAVTSASNACVSGACDQGMCTDIPADNEYYLTSFCDKEVACGKFSGDCNEYFCADYKRFGCGSVVTCCVSTKCINLKVIDGGGCWLVRLVLD